MELWRLSVPAFTLQPVSLLEKMSHYCAPNALMENAYKIQDPKERFVSILGWIMFNWRSIPRVGLESSKPYNPALGEVFKCYWTHDNGDKTVFLAEQISHHPPVTAFRTHSKDRGDFKYEGWVYPITTISYYVKNLNTGPATISFVPEGSDERESYQLIQPPIAANGMMYGNKFIEIYDKMELKCEKTGYSAVINFIAGGENKLTGVIYKDGGAILDVHGVINKKVGITDMRSHTRILYDTLAVKRFPKYINPLTQQDERESRLIWHKVTVALKEKNFDDAQLEKHLVEESERALRKKYTEQHNAARAAEPPKVVEKAPPAKSGWFGSALSYVGLKDNSSAEEKHTGNFGHAGFTPKYYAIEGDLENNWKFTGTEIKFADGTSF
ncbi:hypothetical protein AKO1_013630 [Acrasis kona]|uniref:Oxysterol-binding protein n=1 Tax=Acrasis kona TaxID=1008807 RepID=A0AAW2YVK7_9EUKA